MYTFEYGTGWDNGLWHCYGPDFISFEESVVFFAEYEEDAVLEYLKYAVGMRYS